MQFEDDPFNSETTNTDNILSDKIAEAQQKKWKTLIESIDFTHSSRKAWRTMYNLSNNYAQRQHQCNVTADQVAYQGLLNGKGNSTHQPSKTMILDNHLTEYSMASPFTMEELMKGIKIPKNNKAVGRLR